MASGATLHSPMRLPANELRPAKVPSLSDFIGNRDILPVTNFLVRARFVAVSAFRTISVPSPFARSLARRNASFLQQVMQTAEV